MKLNPDPSQVWQAMIKLDLAFAISLRSGLMPVSVLKDVTVVECATYVTGPYATALLADLGARVIKIESPPDGDPYRYFAPGKYFSPNFAHLHRNKQSILLDLKSPGGRKICLDL